MEFFNNHKKLFRTAFLFFAGLTVLVAIIPALNNQNNNRPLPGAEVLSADAFYMFIDSGNIFNKELGIKYRDTILSQGGSYDMDKLFFNFAQREPSIDSLLKIDGIIS